MPAEAAPGFLLLPELPPPGAALTLSEEESHYLLRVCRARPGEIVSATDGRGGLAGLRVVAGGKRATVSGETCDRRNPARQAWLLVGPPEGERGDWLVEKLAELGVTVFQPIDCARGAWEPKQDRPGRWQRLAAAALRQSRRRFLLEIRPRRTLSEALASLPSAAALWLGDAEGEPAVLHRAAADGISVGLIGPASGLVPQERHLLAERAFRPISLSDGRLRAETAALAWAAWWSGAAPGVGTAHEKAPGSLDGPNTRP